MHEPLDPRQLKRIEAVHRGFLYQHLYAGGCLLSAGAHDVRSVTVEMDEDVEVERASGDRLYIQIKTRTSCLIFSDISDVLDRFDRIRSEHKGGQRAGQASFVIVANSAPGPELQSRLDSGDWPGDVALIWTTSEAPVPSGLPPAWATTDEAIAWCRD